MRSGWKGSSASSFSPVPTNRIGLPVTARTDSAAPPRASPSSLVSATPSKSTASPNALATSTASWPVIASSTSTTLVGLTASRMRTSSSIISASIVRRPAVSTITRSRPGRCGRPRCRAARWPPRRCPSSRCTGTSICAPSTAQLLGGGRAVHVAGHEHRRAALGVEVARELGRAGRLARALQARHQDDGRRLGRQRQGDVGLAHQRGQLVAHDLHDLLVGRERLHHLGALGARRDGRRQLLHHRQADVGLEQRQPDRPHRRVDVGLGELPAAPQAGEDPLQLVGERVEHGRPAMLAEGRSVPVGREDRPGEGAGVERLEVLEPLARAHQLHRDAQLAPDGHRDAPARGAVDLREDDAR